MRAQSLRWLFAGLALQAGLATAQSNTPQRGITVTPSEPVPAEESEPARPVLPRVTPPMPSSVDSEAVLADYRRQLSTGRVDVKAITVSGNTVLDSAAIESVTAATATSRRSGRCSSPGAPRR
jgi:hypothetical protein